MIVKERNLDYKDKNWLFNQYSELKKSMKEIGRICEVSYGTIQYFLKKFDIKIRSMSESQKGKKQSEETKKKRSVSMKKYIQEHPEIWEKSEETKNKISKSHKGKYVGDKNPNWKGDNAGYHPKHVWLRKNKPKPEVCDICGLPEYYNDNLGKLRLSNKTGKLIRDINNFQWVHESCHKWYDKENKIIHEGVPIRKKRKMVIQNVNFELPI